MSIREICDAAVNALKLLPVTDDTTIHGVDLRFDADYQWCTYELTLSLEIEAIDGKNHVMVHACVTTMLSYLLLDAPTDEYMSYDQMIEELTQSGNAKEFYEDCWVETWKDLFAGCNILDDVKVRGLQTTFGNDNLRCIHDEAGCIACVQEALLEVTTHPRSPLSD